MTMVILILGASIIMQLTAAGLALRLVRVAGLMTAWLLVAIALVLMSLRQTISLYHVVTEGSAQPVSLPTELTALFVSGLVLLGILLIRPYFVAHENTMNTLRESEARIRNILDNMVDVYFRTNADNRFTAISRSGAELFGYTEDEILELPIEQLYVNVDDRTAFHDELQKKGKVTGLDVLVQRKDGSQFFLQVNARLLTDEHGVVAGMEGLASDITKRKQAEQKTSRLGRIIEDSFNEIYIFDSKSLNFIFANRGAHINLGYSNDEIRKLTPVDLKPQVSAKDYERLIQPLRDGSAELVTFETLHRRKDGSTYAVDVRIQLARSEDPPVFFTIIRDISQRKRAEEELAQAQKLRAVGQLTGGVAHDFNNLLTIISGNLELAKEEPGLSRVLIEYLDASIGAASRAASLTHRLLAFARKQPLRSEAIDLRNLISGMGELIRQSLSEDVEIQVDHDAELWLCEVDPSQLENALLNLTINAHDSMRNGGKLTIETRNLTLDEEFLSRHESATPGQYVLLSVTDSGHGMSPEIVAQVFDPFFTTKEIGQGSGLGLSMVYGFVKQSGGIIDVYSEVDVGTTIKIYLPRAHHDSIESTENESDIAESQVTGLRILVVEDDEDLLDLTVKMLDRLGYKSTQAVDAYKAIKILEESTDFDLLLTDIILSGSIDGMQLAEEARRRWPDMRVLYMSGYSGVAIMHRGPLDDELELLQKPFTKAQLARKISRSMRSG